MNILAIESSCDETAASIISGDPFSLLSNSSHPQILSNIVVSQIDIFKAYGGVIPEVAARSHLEAILPVIHQAFEQAGFDKNDWSKIDAIAVTHTPGLLGSLLIGTLTARTLAILHQKPLYAVHHLKSHIYANWLEKEDLPSFPLLALVISGGHTQIIYMRAHNDFKIIGTTLDDAVGECFDKIAKILGLPYPGGPSIAAAAAGKITLTNPTETTQQPQPTQPDTPQTTQITPGNPNKYHLPIPKIKGLDFSFSGLKTAVLRAVQKEVGVPISYPSHQLAELLSSQQKADFAASFEKTAIDILLKKLEKTLTEYPDVKSVVIAGGVSANQRLRTEATNLFATKSSSSVKSAPAATPSQPLSLHFPDLKFSGDNAAMVGAAALYEIASDIEPTDPYSLNIFPRSDIN